MSTAPAPPAAALRTLRCVAPLYRVGYAVYEVDVQRTVLSGVPTSGEDDIASDRRTG